MNHQSTQNHTAPKRWNPKTWLLGALMLPLAGCGDVGTTGNIVIPTTLNVGVDVGDSTSTVTVTKAVTPAVAPEEAIPAVPATPTTPAIPAVPAKPGTPEKIVWTSGTAGVASFVFTARPGSDAAYITGFRLTSDKVNGIEQVSNPNDPKITQLKLNMYIPSGYTCPTINPVESNGAGSKTQSCDASLVTTVLGNGASTAPLNINFAESLIDLVQFTNNSAYRDISIQFVGFTSRGKSFILDAKAVATAQKLGDL